MQAKRKKRVSRKPQRSAHKPVRGKIARIEAMSDYSRRPDGWITSLYKPIKKSVTLRLDADVLAWFKRKGRGYQTRINKALRELMEKG